MRRARGAFGWLRASPVPPRYRGLMWMSLMCILLGLAYSPVSNVPSQLPEFLKIATRLLPAATDHWNPVWAFGLAWGIVGIVGFTAPLMRKRLEVVYHIQLGLFSYWSLTYLGAWVLGEPRAWVAGSWFAVMAGATWNFTRVDPPFQGIWGRWRRWIRQ